MGKTKVNNRRTARDFGHRYRKKPCLLCIDDIDWVDYKDIDFLKRYVTERGKIKARRITGNCAQHQRDVAVAIKTARELALLPYTQRVSAERMGAHRRSSYSADPDMESMESMEGIEIPKAALLDDSGSDDSVEIHFADPSMVDPSMIDPSILGDVQDAVDDHGTGDVQDTGSEEDAESGENVSGQDVSSGQDTSVQDRGAAEE
jgi:small subunit ribosomal protein S18